MVILPSPLTTSPYISLPASTLCPLAGLFAQEKTTMKKFILVSDSFKGTLDAAQVCQIQENTIHRLIPDAQVRSIPMADGGEGMVDSYLYIMSGQRKTVTVAAPLGGTVDAVYGILPDGSAVMEMAAAAGLPRTKKQNRPGLHRIKPGGALKQCTYAAFAAARRLRADAGRQG